MMRGIKLTWAGKPYLVPASKAFQVADQIEDVVPFSQISAVLQEMKIAKLSRIAVIILRAAGAKNVTEEDVYLHLKSERDRMLSAAMAGGEVKLGDEMFFAQVVKQVTAILFDGAPEAATTTEDATGNPAGAS